MKKYLFILLITGFALSAYPQNAGDLDNTFGINGKVTTSIVPNGSDWGWAVAIQDNGRIVVGGMSGDSSALVRYLSDGSLDPSFGYAGKSVISGASINCIKLQSDGKIVCAGFINVNPYQVAFSLCRFNSNGLLDQEFGTGGIVTTVFGGQNDYGRALAIQSDGKILVTGECGGWPCDFSTVRYNTNGSVDSTFGTGGVVITHFGNGLNLPKAIAVQSDNKIIVVGHAEPDMAMVRYNPDGSLDSTFGSGGKVITVLGIDSYQTTVLIQPDNKILVAGNYSTGYAYSNVVFRYNPDGSPDISFGTGGQTKAPSGYQDTPNAMVRQENGDFVIAGVSYLGAWSYFELMKFDGNGFPVNSFGYSGRVQTEFNHYDRCLGFVLQSDGKLVASGYTELGGSGVVEFATARYLNDSINVLHLYGTVTDSVTHNPIPNHPVIIDNDTMNGTTYPHHKIVYTDAAGVYNDTVLLPSNLLNWRYIVRTYDGNSNQYYFASGYGSGDNLHDFSIYSCEYSSCKAGFVASQDTSNPLTFHFIDQSEGNITSWYWTFGDNSHSFDRNPVHTFLHAGEVYHVCLIVKDTINSCCDVSCMDVIPGTSVCQANFHFSPDTIVPNSIVHFFDASTGNPTSWDWNFGDPLSGIDNFSSLQNSVHLFSGPGIYTVCLTISGFNCSSSYCRNIVITDSVTYHQLYGQVFAGSFPLQEGLASLFSIDTSQSYLPYTEASMIDSNGVYFFTLVPDGNYMIFAIPASSETYLPTYYGDVIEWEEATLITLGTPVNPYNIHLIQAATMTSGAGSASGHINSGKLPGSMIEKITVTLLDANHHAISFSRVNSGGEFHFPTLDYGTYYLHPEMAGVTSDMVKIEITPSKPHAEVVMTFTGDHINGTADLKEGEEFSIYPNPVTDNLMLSIRLQVPGEIRIELCTITGQIISEIRKPAGSVRTLISVPFSEYKNGIYVLRMHTAEGITITRKVVKAM